MFDRMIEMSDNVEHEMAGAVRLVGTRSAEEEVEDEIRDLKARAAREGSR